MLHLWVCVKALGAVSSPSHKEQGLKDGDCLPPVSSSYPSLLAQAWASLLSFLEHRALQDLPASPLRLINGATQCLSQDSVGSNYETHICHLLGDFG